MPRGNGTGPPWGSSPGTGRGGGMGGPRKGRKGNSRAGAGPVGECICPQCGTTTPHEAGIPCSYKKCPKSDANMMRK